jgi:hypothetical protein
MKFILSLLFLVNCISTYSPGFLFNSTEEHVYKNKSFSSLGTGQIQKKIESCTYHSIIIQPLLHVRPSSLDSLLKEHRIYKMGVVDYSSFSVLGPLYYKNCIIIWGEIE